MCKNSHAGFFKKREKINPAELTNTKWFTIQCNYYTLKRNVGTRITGIVNEWMEADRMTTVYLLCQQWHAVWAVHSRVTTESISPRQISLSVASYQCTVSPAVPSDPAVIIHIHSVPTTTWCTQKTKNFKVQVTGTAGTWELLKQETQCSPV